MTAMPFSTVPLSKAPDAFAPDGAEVRILAALADGTMAHFQLRPGQVSAAVRHRTVEEIWFVLSGSGQMWRLQDGREEVTDLRPGLSLTIPLGTDFQFRAIGDEPLAVVAITMPPWPGPDEAVFVEGKW